MNNIKKSKWSIIGIVLIINIFLTILRFRTKDIENINATLLSTIIFFVILVILLYFFLYKQYDYFIITWLSFYFACPIIVLPFTNIGSLGLYNAIFVPLMLYKTFDYKNKKLNLYLTIILILLTLSIIHIANSNIRLIISRIFLFITPFLFFYFVLKKCKDFKLILWISIFITLINVPIGIYELIFHPEWGTGTDWRGVRIFGNLFWHNSYALYLLPSILTLYAVHKSDNKPIYIILILLLITMSVFTFSRNGFITLILSIITFELIYKTGFKLTRKKIVISLILLLMIIFYISIQSKLGYHLQPDSINERTAIWESITPFLNGHVILGNGIGSYDMYRVNFLNELSTHNSYLNIIFEIGIIGLILFLIFIYFIFKDLKTKIKFSDSLRSGELGIALLIGILCYSIFGNAAFSQVVSLNAWIILACCVKYNEKN